ncbi:DUF2332 domain-containing protein [Phytomonospora endophytica]|uniref:DUF2332 domain-containing protein n=1 Tax=Phytomonospora endophytica TaxID=714109 RepID=A0A841FJN9_9ACTN|nr:DUF2332 domain-containing protein [Phytomonospora endophytica]MBB6035163.1 hypothetical protein [Phytomonospora endophytica]GIG64088.1 hypothetical protein Pen01_03830 [Phytomonospora endophytica]
MSITADWYRSFATRQLRGMSRSYERLAHFVADDARLLALLDELPEPKRQPNLLFAATRYLGGPTRTPEEFHDWLMWHWDEVAAQMLARRTQTNEAGRCAPILPILAALPQPLALLEVGASAGLCLYPDRYRYRYGGRTVGDPASPVLLECAPEGDVPVPDRVPHVVWRAGLDLNPLDITDDDVLRWLSALVWPEQEHRRARLHAAAELTRRDPPRLVRGDLLTDLPALAAQAPADATLVVFHTSVLGYVLDPADRENFAGLARSLPGHWISNEDAEVFPSHAVPVTAPANGPEPQVVALDGRAVAIAGSHGQSVKWL